MSDVAKPDPAADQTANPGATLVKDETAKVTTNKAADQPETSTTSTAESNDKPITEKAAEAAASAAATVKDNVFSMFGGGPAKVKKEEVDDADEPSGASKPKATEARSTTNEALAYANKHAGGRPRERGAQCRFPARRPPHREGRHQDQRGARGASV
jgi:Ran-binding protein 1